MSKMYHSHYWQLIFVVGFDLSLCYRLKWLGGLYVTSLRGLGFLHGIVAGICEAASQQQVFQEAQVSLWTSFILIYWWKANTGPAQIMVENTTQGCEHQEVWSMGRLYWETSYHMKIIRILNVNYYKYASLSALKFSRYRCINIIEWF